MRTELKETLNRGYGHMKELADRIAMQHLINAYSQETSKGVLLERYQQNSMQLTFSQGLTLLLLPLPNIQSQLWVPLTYMSPVGRHRVDQLPQIFCQGKSKSYSPIGIVSLLLEELLHEGNQSLDATSLIQRWAESRDALLYFLQQRESHFDSLVKARQSFIESEQALILGHSMHPAPKSRVGFIHEDWEAFSPELRAKTQLVYWLVAPEYIAEASALDKPISIQLSQEIRWYLTEVELQLLQQYSQYKLLPLHPWQARYLQSKPWFKTLKSKNLLIDLGEKAWVFSPTTSVRTMASFSAPWMLKPSLSVMITNSLRVNQVKECCRGEMTYRLWHSALGQNILKNCSTLKAVNDPAWMALKIDDEIVNETICIFRDQPFNSTQQITCIASLCQDHPTKQVNRFNALFEQIQQRHHAQTEHQIALNWFKQFLKISLPPLMYLYHEYGMAFEAHQQNVLLELEDDMPKQLWLRDNQGFYYIEELATVVLKSFPELAEKAHAVGSQSFVDEKFSYYFFGNTLFGVINAIGITDWINEFELLDVLKQELYELLQQYPESSLLQALLYSPYFPYKANLLTRLHELDELLAPVEHQSIYIQLKNPLCLMQEDTRYA